MEFLGKVYDGSENEIGNGYPLCKMVASDIESKKVIPFYCEAYSYSAEDTKSYNTQILRALKIILKHIGDKGIHAMGRVEIEENSASNISAGIIQYVLQVEGIFNLLYPDKTALQGIRSNTIYDFQLCFEFG